MKNISNILDATNPDLRDFMKNGGKMIHYHGWADTALTPLMTVAYYEEVCNFMGSLTFILFLFLFLVSGFGFQCSGFRGQRPDDGRQMVKTGG